LRSVPPSVRFTSTTDAAPVSDASVASDAAVASDASSATSFATEPDAPTAPGGSTVPDAPTGARSRVRPLIARGLTVLAFLLVWAALVAPNRLSRLTPAAFVRIPVEGLVILVLALVLPTNARRIVAAIAGALLALLVVIKILDVGYFAALDRPFNPITDWGNFGPAVGVLRDSIGRTGAIAAVIGAAILVLGLVVLVTLSMLRAARAAARHRRASTRSVAALAAVWILCAAFGVQIVGAPVASTSAAALTYDQVHAVQSGVADQQAFAKGMANDPFRNTPSSDLLTGLRGKDVIVAFVESYGRVAVQGSAFSPQVDAVLNDGTKKLQAAGFSAKSAFLTSPTFGGISWLAHSTLQSGLWIDNQQRYNQLVTTDRFTLSDAFKRAGWRTVGDVASNHQDWHEGTSFYHYDKIYDDRNVGYAGPNFSYAAQPDQYILSAFQRLELSKPNHAPVMAEIDLVSSHTPWAPLPRAVPWNQVGNGSIFDNQPAQGQSAGDVWQDSSQVKAAYGQSIKYSLSQLISFVQTYHDKNLVLLVLGDHQPATIVSGEGASHDVPITIIAHDPAVMNRIASWGWQDGMLPSPTAPVWPMDAFRNRFLSAYDTQPAPATPPATPPTRH
jgi:hypothetical protein